MQIPRPTFGENQTWRWLRRIVGFGGDHHSATRVAYIRRRGRGIRGGLLPSTSSTSVVLVFSMLHSAVWGKQAPDLASSATASSNAGAAPHSPLPLPSFPHPFPGTTRNKLHVPVPSWKVFNSSRIGTLPRRWDSGQGGRKRHQAGIKGLFLSGEAPCGVAAPHTVGCDRAVPCNLTIVDPRVMSPRGMVF